MKSKGKVYSGRDETIYLDEHKYDLLNIWDANPAFEDLNIVFLGIKTLSVLGVVLFFIIGTYLLTLSLQWALTMGLITVFLYLFAFSDTMFSLKGLRGITKGSFRKIPFFDHVAAFFTADHPEILYITNKEESKTTGMSIFRITILPETTNASYNQVLKSLNELAIPFTFQIHQSPLLFELKEGEVKEYVSQAEKGIMKSFQTFVLLTIHYDINGILTSTKLVRLQKFLRETINNIYTTFAADFHHYRPELLKKEEILYALRGIILKNTSYDIPKDAGSIPLKVNVVSVLLKTCFCAFILVYSYFLLSWFNASYWVIGGVLTLLFILCVWIWWRSLLYYFSMVTLQSQEDIYMVNPMEGIEAYRHRHFPESIFFLVNKKILIHQQMFNLEHAALRYYVDEKFHDVKIPSFFADKFFSSLIERNYPFIYTVNATPMSYHLFDNMGYKYLNTSTKRFVDNIITEDNRGYEWLQQRSGIWKMIFLTSTYSYKFVNNLSDADFYELTERSEEPSNHLRDAIKMIFHSFEMVPLRGRKLISGCLCELLKTKLFTLTGTRLTYLLVQGHGLKFLVKIEDVFKKGVETRLPVEFNSPLSLENFITFGHTVNTEMWKHEIPVGFTLEQLHNVLIVNGSTRIKDLLTMKLIAQLIQVQVPSLIFDFNGEWSRLLTYFKDSSFSNEIVHFRLGSAFGLDVIHSDIPYDSDNPGYLEYVYDAYGLVFKKSNEVVEQLRNTIRQNSDMDMSSLSTELKNQPHWEKTKYATTLISIFDALTESDTVFFNNSSLTQKDVITFLDFINDQKTVIIDLSSIKDVKKKLFAIFILLAKMIHYVTRFDSYTPKIVILSHLDLVFDENYLDKELDPGKIDTFLEPLYRAGFGFMVSANQIHYLHSHFITYFKNILTFHAPDYRDGEKLKPLMGLQEFGGQGFYSKTRNTTYQMEYLRRMPEDEAILMREDVNQPFLVNLDLFDIKTAEPMPYFDIVRRMKDQGYNLQLAERRIIDHVQKTIFEKDFEKYAEYIDDIIIFLHGLKQVHHIALYKSKIEEELINLIKQKAFQRTKDKRSVRKLRNELFAILVSQRYLVDAHPKDAAGRETTATCYMVGPHFDEALQDYDRAVEREALYNMEPVYMEHESEEEGYDMGPDLEFNEDLFQETLNKELQDFYFELFRIFKFMRKKDFTIALQIEKKSIKTLLTHLYHNLYQVSGTITEEELIRFCAIITKENRLPFSNEELVEYLHFTEKLNERDTNIESLGRAVHEKLSQFYHRIRGHIDSSP
jgi:hypothetical protein